MDQNMRRIRPYEGSEPYMFISYSHKDSDKVLPLLHMLKDAGFRFWYDEGIDPGTEWPESIATHLEKSKVCLSFISPEYVLSNNCRREVNFALSRNLDYLSVILEPTAMSAGMEMQISSYMSLLAYRYPSREEFFEKLCRVEILQKCRGESPVYADFSASSDASPVIADSAPKTEMTQRFNIKPLIPVFAFIIAGAVILTVILTNKNKSSPIASEQNAQLPAVTYEDPGSLISDEAPEETGLQIADTPVVPSEDLAELPELGTHDETDDTDNTEFSESPASDVDSEEPSEYRRLAFGEWTYGSIAVFVEEDNTLHVELTDNRVPYGYPMSETPGNNNASWNVMFFMGMSDSAQIDIIGSEDTSSLQQLTAYVSYFVKGNAISSDSLKYALNGNTFSFDLSFPANFPFSVDDIQILYVNLGTQVLNFTDHYEFYPD
ncbi:MAG: toll/interleukin-1 receptor domain-containing protein [Oscillospiraceae bacterium]|nr:toll/interleukin-1 receptor domain-containing protein [Oscillospiraceae bacterium]